MSSQMEPSFQCWFYSTARILTVSDAFMQHSNEIEYFPPLRKILFLDILLLLSCEYKSWIEENKWLFCIKTLLSRKIKTNSCCPPPPSLPKEKPPINHCSLQLINIHCLRPPHWWRWFLLGRALFLAFKDSQYWNATGSWIP